MNTLELKSEHILDGQSDLCMSLAKFCHFEGYTLYFPTHIDNLFPQLLPNEQKLMLPLLWDDTLLGVLVLHKVSNKQIRKMLSLFPAIVSLTLKNMALTRTLRMDATTGLEREEALYKRMEEESNIVKNPDMRGKDISHVPAYRLCMGMILLRLCNGAELTLRLGYSFVEEILHTCATTVKSHVPSNIVVARADRFEFGLLFHATGREKCRKLAEQLLHALQDLSFVNPLTQQKVHPLFAAAFAYYPHDMQGLEMNLPMYEQSRILKQRVSLALDVASPNRCLGYIEIKAKGGRIVEPMPLGRYRISLGRLMGVRPGDRFAVFSLGKKHHYKGDIIIVQARKRDSIAEVRYQEQAGVSPSVGDTLEYIRNINEQSPYTEDMLLSPQEFYHTVQERSSTCSRFTLVMLHIDSDDGLAPDCNRKKALFEHMQHCKEEEKILLGRHGPNIFVFFHPDKSPEDLFESYKNLCTELLKENVSCACGLAGYPLLSFHRTDIQDCVLKTLEYAQLLPDPRVGICNSLTFTISADKLMSIGDYFGAQEEYQYALSLDEENDIAWNSMGVCMAALGRKEDARRHFLNALNYIHENERKAQILYNLGTISQDLHDSQAAFTYLKECTEKDPKHLYARIRLGQLYEVNGDTKNAICMYEEGAKIEEESHFSSTVAHRHLARLAAKDQGEDSARSILQEALRHNPNDAAAMLKLAKIYLDSGENPAIAEVLARNSVGIYDSPEGWRVLAQALHGLGKEEDACAAEAQALVSENR